MSSFVRSVFCSSLFLFAFAASGQSAHPLWSVDLAKDKEFAKRIGLDSIGLVTPRLQFAGPDLIVVGFENDEPNQPRTLVPKRFDFDLLELDSASGSVIRRSSFPVVNVDSDVQPIAAGELLVLAGESLNKQSHSLQTLQTYATVLAYHGGPVPQVIDGRPDLSVAYEGWKMSVTPLGHSVVLQHKNRQRGELTWLNTSDLSVQRVVTEPEPGTTLDATDDFALLSTWSPPYRTEPKPDTAPECPLSKCDGLYILNDTTFLKYREHKYEIVDRDGKVIMHGSLRNRIGDTARSMDGSRAAFSSGTLSIGFFTAGATNSEITVIDLAKRKEVTRIAFETPPTPYASIIGGKREAIALSPDGHRIAILQETKLTCYQLP